MLPALVLMLSGVPDAALFEKARTLMAETLAKQSNYVCLETIDRTQRVSAKERFNKVDSIRVEVAFIGKRELYSWPGARKFDDKDLLDLVSNDGAISTGTFAGHVQKLMNAKTADVGSGEWINQHGKQRARFPFAVPVDRSRYKVMKTRYYGAIVEYSGEIWIDPDTGRITRLRLRSDSIPEDIGIDVTEADIEYGAATIGTKEFWLPVHSTESVIYGIGPTDRNSIRLSGCHEFTGESKISFGEDVSGSKDSGSTTPVVEVPAGIDFEIQFTEAVNTSSLHVGDLIPATLTSEIKHNDTVLFAKGSAVEVRLVRFRKTPLQMMPSVALGEVSSSAATARLLASPHLLQKTYTIQRGKTRETDFEIRRDMERPSLGTIYMRGASLRLPKGYRTSWVTRALSRVPKEERQ